jgi:hypothetical protein
VRALYAWLPAWARWLLKKWGAVVKVRAHGGNLLGQHSWMASGQLV